MAHDDAATRLDGGTEPGFSEQVWVDQDATLIMGEVRLPASAISQLALGETKGWGEARLLGLGNALVVGYRGRTVMLARTHQLDLSPPAREAIAGMAIDGLLLHHDRDTFADPSQDTAPGVNPVHPVHPIASALAGWRREAALAPHAAVLVCAEPGAGPSARRLAAWGARRVERGDVTALGSTVSTNSGSTSSGSTTRTLVLGPASSGKSAHAEDLLAAQGWVDYLATGRSEPDDDEWQERIERHRCRRGAGWRTLEAADDPGLVLGTLSTQGHAVLWDSVGSWVTGALSRAGAWERQDGWRSRYHLEVQALVSAWRGTPRRVVGVSEETGWSLVPTTWSGRVFQQSLSELNQLLAAGSECRIVVAGQILEPQPW